MATGCNNIYVSRAKLSWIAFQSKRFDTRRQFIVELFELSSSDTSFFVLESGQVVRNAVFSISPTFLGADISQPWTVNVSRVEIIHVTIF